MVSLFVDLVHKFAFVTMAQYLKGRNIVLLIVTSSLVIENSHADRFEKINNSYGSDGEKNQPSYSKNLTTVNHGDPGVSSIRNESTHSGLIPMEGCCTSEAAQLLTERTYLDTRVIHLVSLFSLLFFLDALVLRWC